jgi:hypothetical protein
MPVTARGARPPPLEIGHWSLVISAEYAGNLLANYPD